MQQPDFVFFMTDQLSAKWLEAACAGAAPTPNIDRFRARGVTFTRAYTSNPVCMAARATLATGLTTRQHGVLQNGYQLDPALPTFMQLLQGAGWRTGMLGKFHVRPHFRGVHPDYHEYGFDVVHNTEDPRAGEWLDWIRDEHPEQYDSVLVQIYPHEMDDFQEYGGEKESLRERILALREKGYDWSTPEFPEGEEGFHPLNFPEELSQTAWITGHGVDFIRSTPADTPLMAHISYVQPHGPYIPPRETIGLVDTSRIPEALPPTWADDPNHPKHLDGQSGFPNTIGENTPAKRHCYFADIAHLDQKLGEVMDVLDETGRADNTWIIFLADHGDMLGDMDFFGKESKHYDACVRVPMIIAGPGVAGGRVVESVVQLEDIVPTVLELAGVEYPPPPILGPYNNEPPGTLPGHSLVPWLKGKTPTEWPDDAYIESYDSLRTAHYSHWSRTVVTADWRYSWYADRAEQLFDLKNDPNELTNLAHDPAYSSIRNEMRDRLLERVIMQDWPHTRRELFAHGVH